MRCSRVFLDKEIYRKIESGIILSKSSMKRYLIHTFGDKCSICGIETWQGKRLVKIMDHIDGNPYNNSVSNLRLVCSNCDSQLPTYKSKNKGKGRHSRRIRYENGESY